jgi:hypothetical protein
MILHATNVTYLTPRLYTDSTEYTYMELKSVGKMSAYAEGYFSNEHFCHGTLEAFLLSFNLGLPPPSE